MVDNHFSLPTVLAKKEGSVLNWQAIKNAKEYRIYKNGKVLKTTTETLYKTAVDNYASYMVSAVDNLGFEGFTSEPIVFSKSEIKIEMENFVSPSKLPSTNFSGKGFVEISLSKNKEITIKVEVEIEGEYILDFKYSNGNGPWNTDNKCAIRSLTVNDQYEGVMVFPQRGQNEWSDWGFSNGRKVHLNAGANTIKLHFEDWNNNMNVEVNTAMLDYLRVIKFDTAE
jgi:hypothetical protein